MKESKNNVINYYYLWSAHIKSHNNTALLVMVAETSSFHELTNTCQKSHESGTSYFYEFDKLELIGFSNDKTEAKVTGIIKLIIPKIDIVYSGIFISTCCRINLNSNWLLNDIDIEWH